MSMMLATTALAALGATPAQAAPPTAVASATPTSGNAPVTATFSAALSSDPDPGDTLTYAWDFDDDGTVDAQGLTASHTFASHGLYPVVLRVTDRAGNTAADTVEIHAINTPPLPVIDAPSDWRVGEPVRLSAHATDAEQGAIPPSGFAWTVSMRRCAPNDPSSCALELVRRVDGADRIVIAAPDVADPAQMVVALVATDRGGLWSGVEHRIEPRTVELSIDSDPSGVALTVGSDLAQGPIVRTVVAGARVPVAAPGAIRLDGVPLTLVGWSDGGSASHEVIVPNAPTATITARYANRAPAARLRVTTTASAAALDASGSTDPDDHDVLSYAWDLDADGSFDDGTGSQARATAAKVSQVRVQVTDLAGNHAVAKVGAASPAVPPTISRVRGPVCREGRFLARYFTNAAMRGAPAIERCEARPGRNWGTAAPAPAVPADGFSAAWSGQVRDGGRYRLRVRASGGVRVWLGGRVVLNRPNARAGDLHSLTLSVPAGGAPMRVAFVDRPGASALDVSLSQVAR